LNYNDVYDIIAMYAQDLLPMFADHWERWPAENFAETLTAELKKKALSWPSHQEVLMSAANAIEKNSQAPVSSSHLNARKLASVLDGVADRLEAQGLIKEAFELDKVADLVEKEALFGIGKKKVDPTSIEEQTKRWNKFKQDQEIKQREELRKKIVVPPHSGATAWGPPKEPSNT
jgi:hypothetical protein